MTKTKKLEMTV